MVWISLLREWQRQRHRVWPAHPASRQPGPGTQFSSRRLHALPARAKKSLAPTGHIPQATSLVGLSSTCSIQMETEVCRPHTRQTCRQQESAGHSFPPSAVETKPAAATHRPRQTRTGPARHAQAPERTRLVCGPLHTAGRGLGQ